MASQVSFKSGAQQPDLHDEQDDDEAIAPSIAANPRLCFDGSRLAISGSLDRNRDELGPIALEGNLRKRTGRRTL
jgi:hypothetical protein